MNPINLKDSIKSLMIQPSINQILETNNESQKYGLMLSPEQAVELIEARNQAIENHSRVELGLDVIKKIIMVFASSKYIIEDEYANILNELVEIFYFMKNETEDRLSDDELIALMKDFFDTSCRGSIDLLKNRELAVYARKLRSDLLVHGVEGDEDVL